MLNARNGRLKLKTVKGMALPFAFLYRSLVKDFTVYVFSRRVHLSPEMSTREMAEDLNLAMEALGLSSVALFGVSQGGMISQWLTIDHPDKVGKLVLTVTLSKPNNTVRDVIHRWLDMAERGDYKGRAIGTEDGYRAQWTDVSGRLHHSGIELPFFVDRFA